MGVLLEPVRGSDDHHVTHLIEFACTLL